MFKINSQNSRRLLKVAAIFGVIILAGWRFQDVWRVELLCQKTRQAIRDFLFNPSRPTVSQESRTKEENNTKPLNILLLYADDWRHDSLGKASDGLVKTPFLDKFAEESIRFTHNCVSTSVCWVSRATLFTGQYLSRHKSSLPKHPHFYQHWANQSFPGLLRNEGGYHVGHIGKWQFIDFNEKMRHHFDFARIYEGKHWYPPEVPGGPPLHTIDRNQRDALDFLKTRPSEKPFMLTVAFYPPHSVDGTTEQYFPQNKTMSLYQKTDLPPPKHPNMTESWRHLPSPIFDERNEGRNRWHIRFDNPSKYQHMLKNYYRLVNGVDAACERIVQELKRQGVYDNTLVIFTADNGLYHGEHGLAGKWYAHQESVRIPLIIRDPRMDPSLHNSTNDDFTLNVDLAPTMLNAAGIVPPTTMQGQDISQLYFQKSQNGDNSYRNSMQRRQATGNSWRDDFFYEHPRINVAGGHGVIPASTALVRKDYKYIHWTSDDNPTYQHPAMEQLFDLTKDPKEEEDLVARPDYFQVLSEMRTRHDYLKEWVK